MFIAFKKIKEDNQKIYIELNYNNNVKGEAIYNKQKNTFSYMDNIDEKIAEWRPVSFIEKQIDKKMIKINAPCGIYAIG